MHTSLPPCTPGRTSFSPCGPLAMPLLRVNPDVPCRDALAHVANLQRIATQLMTESAMGDGEACLAWAAVYLGEMAQAIVEDLSTPPSQNSD
ncbi:DUF3077 domain-containing protein [Pseudomonas sp. HR96]|uniref:DUF3077 domain-containing protein n=1 Tax=Pseudomonas sp. HR96 TaxID=1027966 RepID=UPI002A749045|nr:DUF3077 domain-containing protein [Pseudomonas sp. HR96]WPO99466.1 DUF3077 domain-containing protein [Pseudomonas sp. HR96]